MQWEINWFPIDWVPSDLSFLIFNLLPLSIFNIPIFCCSGNWWLVITPSIIWNIINIRFPHLQVIKTFQVIKMEVECSNSRPPGPDSLTGEEEVNFAIMIIAITTVIIVITITINCVSTNVFAGGHGEVFRECKQMASCPRAQTGLTLIWWCLPRSNVSLDSEYLQN